MKRPGFDAAAAGVSDAAKRARLSAPAAAPYAGGAVPGAVTDASAAAAAVAGWSAYVQQVQQAQQAQQAQLAQQQAQYLAAAMNPAYANYYAALAASMGAGASAGAAAAGGAAASYYGAAAPSAAAPGASYMSPGAGGAPHGMGGHAGHGYGGGHFGHGGGGMHQHQGGGGGGGGPMGTLADVPNRSVYVGNLPEGVTPERVLDVVYGGLVDAVRVVPDKQCAFVNFIYPSGAHAFLDGAATAGVTLGDRALRVGACVRACVRVRVCVCV
jgi:hypothetical protein